MQNTTEIQSFFDRLADTWDTYNQEDGEKLRSMLSTTGLVRHAHILDIGCGTGILFPYLLEYAPAHIDAVDISARMVEIAQKKNTDARIHVYHTDFYDLPKSITYDVAVIYNAYPHFLDKPLFTEKLFSLLAPGGRFILMHGSGRKKINGVHHGRNASAVSTPLRPCIEEAQTLSRYFEIDTRVDTQDCYILSGTSRESTDILSAHYL
ncbi:MAG: class I SAM-dependent methyltransferase [Christensenella sp.]|uniref:class I SAM-dependent DNA methyltransferase n=1 Tax=Christensenella sp. TaxID=1935934 RepID=UPI002B21D716|nr:class I SAM-dependent methyltransferase [Christensenella sp.]MEA5004051.1 class I SAM-dependent methyltransferase [Christensenella sp.]